MTVRELICSLLEVQDMNAPVCVRVDPRTARSYYIGERLVGVIGVDTRPGVAVEIEVEP